MCRGREGTGAWRDGSPQRVSRVMESPGQSPQKPDIQWQREGGEGRGHVPRAALSRGRHFKEDKKFWPVHGHLNALQLSIPVHQRCSVTFKVHQFYLRPGRNPIRTGEPPLSSRLGPRARRGGRTNICPGLHRPSRNHCRYTCTYRLHSVPTVYPLKL